MNASQLSRRSALARAGLLAGAAILSEKLVTPSPAAPAAGPTAKASFRYSLNLATLRGHKLGIVKQVEIAAQAGYDGIEPWVDAIDEYVKAGNPVEDLRKRISDAGLTVEGAIGFPEWIVEDDARRAQRLPSTRCRFGTARSSASSASPMC